LADTFEDIKNKARIVRQIDLKAILTQTGAIHDNFDKAKWHTPLGTISITGQKFFNWNQGFGGGGAIDLIIHLKEYDFKTAVSWLFENFALCCPPVSKPAQKPALRLPIRDDRKLAQIVNYLSDDRCVPDQLINSMINLGTLYADKRANAVFLLLGKENRVVGAELRGTSKKRWLAMALGSRKDLGCFYVKRSNTKKIVLCESAIDALSCFTINQDVISLSTSGVTANPAWLTTFIDKGLEIYCGFDADDTGDSFAEKMVRLFPNVKRLRPIKHDWNDVLRSKSEKS
jgi:hypothetical protein